MKLIRFSDLTFVPASHEDPQNPGVLKKVLFGREDIVTGKIQMINWAHLPSGKSFRSHYHEDMDEIFILTAGVAKMKVSDHIIDMQKGDGVIVEMKEVHTMKNETDKDVEYLVIGVTRDQNGKTINVAQVEF